MSGAPALSDSLPLFQALFETAPDAMVVIDRGGTIALANPQATRLFGIEAAALLGAPIEVLLPESVRAAHRGHRDRYIAQPRVRPMGAGQELVGRRGDGTQFPVEIALSPIRTDQGDFFVASIRDISATQRERQAMARARYDSFVAQVGQLALQAPLEQCLDRVPELVATALGVDAVLVVLGHGSRAALQVRAAHGAAPQQLEALLDACGRAAAAAPVASGDEVLRLQPVALHGSGFGSAVAARLFDLEQPLGAVLALARSEREFDRDARHFLQSVANVLAAALQRHRTQEQLAHAQRLEAVGQLTGGIAHDFNNLLTMISGNLQLLEAELADQAEVQAPIASALRAVGRGAELTRKLLAFARRQRLSPRPVAPAQLLADLGLMLRRTLGEQVDVEIDCPPDLGAAFVDPAQLDAALLNLALNARDAMPRGGRLRIAARTRRITPDVAHGEARPGSYVVFAVEDSGSGMAPDVLARAFEPFFTTKAPGKGSGLGLSMVYGFVKQSGGHLQVDSQPGRGTCIELFLPAASAAAVEAGATQAAPRRGHESVLVVEDEPEVRGIAMAFLRSLGYVVHAAGNAAEALALLQQEPAIELLFSDVILGSGASGGELAETARCLRPGLPVLLTSGYERPAAASEAQPGSQFELLRKPYRREELAAAVRRVLEAKAG